MGSSAQQGGPDCFYQFSQALKPHYVHFVSILNTFHCGKPCLCNKFLRGDLPDLAHSLGKPANQTPHWLPSPTLPKHTHKKPATSSFVTLDNSMLGTCIPCVCFWEINWNVHRGDIGCLHFSSSLYQTICHVSKPESEFGFISHPRLSHGHPRCALNGFDFANDIAFVDDRHRRRRGSQPQPLHPPPSGLLANPSAINQS